MVLIRRRAALALLTWALQSTPWKTLAATIITGVLWPTETLFANRFIRLGLNRL